MLNIDDYNTLTQITDTTWGRASTDATPTMSVKMSFVGEDVAVVKYVTVVTYAGNRCNVMSSTSRSGQ